MNLVQFREFSKFIDSMQDIDEGMDLLPSSILLSLVATYDSIISDFMRKVLALRPDRLETHDKSITYKELFGISNLEDVKNRLIEEEVNSIMRGSHLKQAEHLEPDPKLS